MLGTFSLSLVILACGNKIDSQNPQSSDAKPSSTEVNSFQFGQVYWDPNKGQHWKYTDQSGKWIFTDAVGNPLEVEKNEISKQQQESQSRPSGQVYWDPTKGKHWKYTDQSGKWIFTDAVGNPLEGEKTEVSKQQQETQSPNGNVLKDESTGKYFQITDKYGNWRYTDKDGKPLDPSQYPKDAVLILDLHYKRKNDPAKLTMERFQDIKKKIEGANMRYERLQLSGLPAKEFREKIVDSIKNLGDAKGKVSIVVMGHGFVHSGAHTIDHEGPTPELDRALLTSSLIELVQSQLQKQNKDAAIFLNSCFSGQAAIEQKKSRLPILGICSNKQFGWVRPEVDSGADALTHYIDYITHPKPKDAYDLNKDGKITTHEFNDIAQKKIQPNQRWTFDGSQEELDLSAGERQFIQQQQATYLGTDGQYYQGNMKLYQYNQSLTTNGEKPLPY